MANSQTTNQNPPAPRRNDLFRKLAHRTSASMGSAVAFFAAVAIIVAWGITGPIFHFSDTWQLVINTGTTIVTFLMVFLIQNTQNRDALAMHLKLDELIRALEGARNKLVDLEDLSDQELQNLKDEFCKLSSEEVVARIENARTQRRSTTAAPR